MLQVVACLGVSEPGGGSDVAACQTTARRVGDDLVINGQKMWITNAFQADWICLLANTEEGPGECGEDPDYFNESRNIMETGFDIKYSNNKIFHAELNKGAKIPILFSILGFVKLLT